ncbi:hypothetical protein CAEBREN_07242 [Caenorhabditis brenneri]|uniref:Uncharacterized protein n=1 Tax=Caenorhabditis brenneri TaxID=135651 RepID=G0NK58_CAEBE|nr:hypothetical protein CAEBREN_07242 [Caenorhabditis brenneri]
MASFSSILLISVCTVGALAVMEHNSYYPGGHSTSYYQPYQTHTYGSKYYNTESYGKYDEHGNNGKDSHYEPTYYNPVASYYHSYMPKYHGGHNDYYTKYNQYTPYYGGSHQQNYYEQPKHDDYHGRDHHFDMHK